MNAKRVELAIRIEAATLDPNCSWPYAVAAAAAVVRQSLLNIANGIQDLSERDEVDVEACLELMKDKQKDA